MHAPELVAVVTAEGQGQRVHAAGPGHREAAFPRERAPLPLLLLVHQAREDVDPPLLPPLGAKVAQHDAAQEHAVERHDDQDVQVRVAVAGVRLRFRAALGEGQAAGQGRGVLPVLHRLSARSVKCPGTKRKMHP